MSLVARQGSNKGHPAAGPASPNLPASTGRLTSCQEGSDGQSSGVRRSSSSFSLWLRRAIAALLMAVVIACCVGIGVAMSDLAVGIVATSLGVILTLKVATMSGLLE